MNSVNFLASGRGLEAAPTVGAASRPRPEFVGAASTPRPHAANLRKGRVSIPGQIYLVTTVTQNRVPLFQDFATGRKVVSALRHHHENGNAQTIAYVLMPDHLHWLFALEQNITLPRLLASVKGYTARRIGVDQVWQEGYHDHALRRDEDVRGTARYVVANPLRAGLVQRLGDYPLWDAMWLP